jgi:hypothetical protein
MSEFTHDGGAWDDQPGWHEGVGLEHGLGTGWDTGSTDFAANPGYSTTAESGVPAEIGNPAEYQQDWFFQQHNGYCVPSSVTQVVEAQTGTHLDGYGLVEQEAAKLGLPQTDLTLPQAQELLQGFGVSSHIVEGGSPQTAVNDLAGYLEQGRNVVLSVNASPIWYGSADTSDNPQGQPDHALVVSAIDPQTGTVTLSDPGTPDGNEEQVSLSTFLQAWSASDYGMLVTDHPDTGTASQTAVTGGTDQPPAATASPAGFGAHAVFADLEYGIDAVGHGLDAAAHGVAHAAEDGFVVLPIALAAAWVFTEARRQTGHA